MTLVIRDKSAQETNTLLGDVALSLPIVPLVIYIHLKGAYDGVVKSKHVHCQMITYKVLVNSFLHRFLKAHVLEFYVFNIRVKCEFNLHKTVHSFLSTIMVWRCRVITECHRMRDRASKVEERASIWVLFHCSCIH